VRVNFTIRRLIGCKETLVETFLVLLVVVVCEQIAMIFTARQRAIDLLHDGYDSDVSRASIFSSDHGVVDDGYLPGFLFYGCVDTNFFIYSSRPCLQSSVVDLRSIPIARVMIMMKSKAAID
jgi:hypothetical protein